MQFLSLAPVSSATTDHNVAGDGHEGEGVDRWCPSISAERATQKSAELHESKIGNFAAPVTNPQGEASRLTSLQTKRSELEVQLQARTTTASNAKEALQRHREAVDAVKGEVAEEWRQTELAGKQLAEEGAARQRAAERLAVLRREKASLCKQLEAAKWNLATASAE
ncbi:unnamed protein product, partial [Symbiodinium necroappetens]